MIILHYSLGFPPYRSGGMTKFCMDLMKEQRKEGHKVGLLWPGTMKITNHEVSIKEGKPVEGIGNYEIINPLPIPYDEGIKFFSAFMTDGDKTVYKQFLQKIKPGAIHIHTLMGLHKCFLIAAKELGIKLVFTTHDFFPICPKVTMFRKGQVCNSIESCEECGICNNTGLNLRKIQILQSPMYRELKDSCFIRKLRKQHRDEYLSEGKTESYDSVGTPEDYKELRNYYYSMLNLMDVIHYNSNVTKSAYEKVFNLPSYSVITISHSDIADNRRTKKFRSDMFRIRYLGAQSAAKGYYFLKDVLDELWEVRQDFKLDVHFYTTDQPPYMECHERYDYEQLEEIFDDTDVLICPSVWYETFGFTVLEALSFGVPVIISDHVGAKDVLNEESGIVFKSNDKNDLIRTLKGLTISELIEMNSIICQKQQIKTIDVTSKELTKIYENGINI